MFVTLVRDEIQVRLNWLWDNIQGEIGECNSGEFRVKSAGNLLFWPECRTSWINCNYISVLVIILCDTF